MLDEILKKIQDLHDKYGNSLSLDYSERRGLLEQIKYEKGRLEKAKELYQIFVDEDEKWLKKDLEFYLSLKKPEVKEMYMNHIKWEISQLSKLKAKI
jgi:hypothetical protein